MIKKFLKLDVVHHMKNIMLSWHKIALPSVVAKSPSSASHPLTDAPHQPTGCSCYKMIMQAINLHQYGEKGFCYEY